MWETEATARYVCSWRSYDRHWMPNAMGFGTDFSWWHSPCQCVLFFFLAFLQCFRHSWACKISVMVLYGSSIFQVLAHFCAPFFLSPMNGLQVAGRRCSNVSGTSYKLLDEDVATYQERLTSCWTKMLQRIRNVLQVAGRRCYNVYRNQVFFFIYLNLLHVNLLGILQLYVI